MVEMLLSGHKAVLASVKAAYGRCICGGAFDRCFPCAITIAMDETRKTTESLDVATALLLLLRASTEFLDENQISTMIDLALEDNLADVDL